MKKLFMHQILITFEYIADFNKKDEGGNYIYEQKTIVAMMPNGWSYQDFQNSMYLHLMEKYNGSIHNCRMRFKDNVIRSFESLIIES